MICGCRTDTLVVSAVFCFDFVVTVEDKDPRMISFCLDNCFNLCFVRFYTFQLLISSFSFFLSFHFPNLPSSRFTRISSFIRLMISGNNNYREK